MINTVFSNNGTNRIEIEPSPLIENVVLRPYPGIEGYQFHGSSSNYIVVPQGITLALEAGTTLMMPQGTYIHVDGHLEAMGTATQPVTFTSAIDTAMSQWNGIAVFETGTANLNHAVVQYSDWGVGAVDASNNIIQITNSRFTENLSPMWSTNEALHRLQIDNVTFDGNGRNRVDIALEGDGELTANAALTDQPGLQGYEVLAAPYDPLIVPDGITLTLEAGTTMFFHEDGRMQVLGHLHTAGTPTMPVTLTAVDPNNPWFALVIGENEDVPGGTGSALMEETVISNSGTGLVVGRIGENDRVIFQDSVLQNNGYGGELFVHSLHKLEFSNLNFVNNSYNRLLLAAWNADIMEGNTTLTTQPGLEGYQMEDNIGLRIPSGITLTLAPGVTLMSDWRQQTIFVEGRLQAEGTAVNPIILTAGQSSNPGQWQGIVVNGGEVSLAHAEVRYATTNLTVNSPTSTVTITSSRFISASVNSIAVNDGSLYAACSVIAGNGQNGVSVSASGSPSVTITTSEIWGNGVGITNSHSMLVDARHNFWGDPSGPGGIGPGSGDAVYGNVLYDPWLAEPTCSPPVPGWQIYLAIIINP